MRYAVACIFLILICATAFAEESVCVTCHKDIAKEWRTSIHHENDISCHNCHGGNPKDAATAMDPKSGFVGSPKEADVPDFCGKCHVGVKENYLKSDHYRAIGAGGPTCVTCHTAHKQKRANIAMIAPELCGRCHGFERAERIKNAMLLSESEITNLEERIETLHAAGYDMAAVKKELFATRNQFHRLTHVLDVGLIVDKTSGIQTDIGRLKNEIAASEKTEVERKIYGAAFIVFLIIGALVFWWYRNTILAD